jgi:hypothetical protein
LQWQRLIVQLPRNGFLMAAIQADCDSRSDFIGQKMAAALLGFD